MLTHDEPRAPVAHDGGVIDDARRRQRRHWTLGAAALAALAAAALIAVGLDIHGAGRRGLAFGARGPTVNARAFSGEGDLAFISRRTLWVLDGSGGLRRVALPEGVPAAPAFSSDGRWLAFLSTGGNDSIAPWRSDPHLWIAHADGSDPHEIGWLRSPTMIGWSPRSDELAVSDTANGRDTVWLIAPPGARRRLMSAAVVDGGAWSPDGSRIAIAGESRMPFGPTGGPFTASLAVYPIAGGRATVWLRRVARGAPYQRTVFLPAGWWPRWGIGFWTDSVDGNDPSVRDGAGLDLWHLIAPHGRPRLLGSTLSDRALSPITASATGMLAITDARSGAQPFWQGEVVERCSPASQRCSPVREPRGTVSIDPTWSPDGSTLVYLVGHDLGSAGDAGFAQPALARFYDTLELWRYDRATASSSKIASAQGAVVPIWSRSGTRLLFVADDGLWLWQPGGGDPVEVAGPIFDLGSWPAFFAQIDWSDQFAWSRSG